ncbi:hypothetical protein BKA69DRAFT_1061771 [Paraphysoderma sedebokerense]|nr:hypothetical protein BKA69DRAFT_1061771 [Paraphysoderma sedebokerense]
MAKKVAAKTSATSSNEVASSSKAQQLPSYAAETDSMVAKFLKMADMENLGNPNPEWTLIVDELPFIQVYQHINSEHCYKIIVTLDASLYTTFNILADITRRKEWDQMVDETMILQEYSPSTKVQYMRMKPVWPTSARDVVVMAHCRSVDGRLLNVTKSVDHDDMPSREADGVVRMQAGIAGQILETVNVDGVEKTRVVQIADGDPKGWIPKSVVKFVATKALPGSFRHLNKLVAKLPPLDSTNLLIDSESGLPLGSSPTTSGHVSSVKVSSQANSTVAVPAKKPVAVPSVEVKKADRAVAKKYPVSNRFILWIHGYLKFGSPFMVTTMFVLYMIGLYKKR